MGDSSETADRSVETTVDEEREEFGSAGWDALDEDSDESAPDVPKPDPDQDQG